jgi:hypothetical protein
LNQKKKHHYVARTYLRGFCNQEGKVRVYSKDKPAQSWWAAPEAIAYENYYYSQPTPDGGQDNNRIEDFFSSIEDNWPLLISKIEHQERHEGGLEALLRFALMQRVRVPTARDAVEKMLAEAVRMTGRHLNDMGRLPPPPSGFTFEYLDEHAVVSIDPHQSIHAMADLAKGVTKVFNEIGFEILENTTDENFITSDNPVIYFDPTVAPQEMLPYNVSRSRMNIEFMFPLSRRFMLWGHSVLKSAHNQGVTRYRTLSDIEFVKRANVLTVRFANRLVFADNENQGVLVAKYAARSPIVSVTHLQTARGRGVFAQHVFGKREKKPKWTKPIDGIR